MKNYLTISEFAKYVNISRRTLIYYDQIDLFKPVKVSEHGYRYYSCEQCFELDVILTLKFLDVPLEEIRTFLNNRNIDDTLKEFEKRKQILDKKINDLQNRQTFLVNYIDRYTTLKNVQLNQFTHEYRESETFICSKSMCSHYYDTVDALVGYSDFYLSVDQTDLFNGYPINFLVEEPDFSTIQHSSFKSLIKIADEKISRYDQKKIVKRPAGTYVSFFVEDTNCDIKTINGKLIEYLKQNQFCQNGAIWKILWQDEITAKTPEKRIFEILIPIEKVCGA